MADYRVIDVEQLEAGLTVVADAIREKGGTSDPLEFPNGMADAVRTIQTGVQPTEFHNILTDESVTLYPEKRISPNTAGTMEDTHGVFVMEFFVPKGTPLAIRMRGYIPYNIYVNFSVDGGNTWKVCYLQNSTSYIDEYSDTVYITTMGSDVQTVDRLIRINLCFVNVSVNSATFTEENIRNSGAIVAVNEPIGATQDTEYGESYWVESFHGRSIYAYAFYEWKNDNFPYINTSNGTNFQNTFAYSAIKEVPNFDFSKAQQIYRMFNNAKKLKKVTFDFAKVTTNGYEVFRDCASLETVEATNTTNITNFSLWCNGCSSLKSVKTLDFTKATNVSNMFTGCTALEEVEIVAGTLKTSLSFADSPLLSSESIQSIINGLADLTGQTAQALTLHASVKARLTDEQIATITSKNWTLA